MKRKLILLLLVSLTLTTLTGCWNRRELNELGFIVAAAVDKSEDGQYILTVQMVDPSQVASHQGSGGGSRTPVSTYTAKGHTLYEAVGRLSTAAPRRMYWAHTLVYVYGEEAARDGISNLLDFHERDREVRSNFYFIIAKNTKGSEVLKFLTAIEDIPARKMFDSLETASGTWGTTVEVQRDQLISAMTSDGRDPVLSAIQIIGDPEKGKSIENVQVIEDLARLQYKNIAVFRKDKLVGWLNEDESKGFNYTQNKIDKTYVTVPCDGGKVVLEMIRTQVKQKGSVQNGTPQILIQINAEANIAEVQCKMDLMNTATIRELEHKINEKIRSQIMDAVEKCQQQYQADVFGFGEIIHRADPEAWRLLKKDWRKHFVKTQVVFSIDTKIRRIGMITVPPQNVIKE